VHTLLGGLRSPRNLSGLQRDGGRPPKACLSYSQHLGLCLLTMPLPSSSRDSRHVAAPPECTLGGLSARGTSPEPPRLPSGACSSSSWLIKACTGVFSLFCARWIHKKYVLTTFQIPPMLTAPVRLPRAPECLSTGCSLASFSSPVFACYIRQKVKMAPMLKVESTTDMLVNPVNSLCPEGGSPRCQDCLPGEGEHGTALHPVLALQHQHTNTLERQF